MASHHQPRRLKSTSSLLQLLVNTSRSWELRLLAASAFSSPAKKSCKHRVSCLCQQIMADRFIAPPTEPSPVSRLDSAARDKLPTRETEGPP
ncbi:hypothetical protein HBI56_028040 [Parastagonospora nodorum]|uniref:Uncharacterized protein n=1 Tax=Phaeosphaeria nodorum (strain SN15 / ATCC MYA-4574 / FGSC 10173) TaxID=321614 RepID=A0A7U2I071_PHANO|nr:hypothetical protein HBH56_015700 [Parastagonospora nodorum]QRC95041.1 hypothetical protein JI435_406800 [Parastagonospora nodorum SN15]KAH3937088.1 hypothetical protein HBH54_018740 [Parastagonospora nodorum]KAH3953709.1 hypothetical protein HBH53_031140 [Parastagonospora nodorum]KAH3969305.1 hypothetical protein HBH51_123310 [Parastagonospora nodorum]